MDQSNKKIITMSFLGAGVLLAFIFRVLVDAITPVTSGGVARFFAGDFARFILPVLLGFVLFLYLQFNKKVSGWADEVVTEIKKVVWPSRRDTIAMTIVVCVMVLISAGVIGLFDVISSFFVNYLVSL